MNVEDFIAELGVDYFTGVPDSQLRPLCDYLVDTYGIDQRHHVIAANEGNSVGLACGYHLATGKTPVVYMQNSGQGNAVNPIASLISPDVYAVPMIFVIGWRGEPGVHDEPQHVQQGKITLDLLDTLGIAYLVLDAQTTVEDVRAAVSTFKEGARDGKSFAFVVRKGALVRGAGKLKYENDFRLTREEALKTIASKTGDTPIVSTTGKASRELFEIREASGAGHGLDFLTVGSMGHASSIAQGIAAQKPDSKIICLDGDGAVLMHMGALASVGASGLKNFVHIVVNNGAHETVGGMPTVASAINIPSIALDCGYAFAKSVDDADSLASAVEELLSEAHEGPSLLEVKCKLGARADLGRPTTTPIQNRDAFMKTLNELS